MENRIIKFRGYSLENKKWIFGLLEIDRNGDCCIFYYDSLNDRFSIPVVPESIGEFTGMLDRNEKEIYEGDKVNYCVKRKICSLCAANEIESELLNGLTKFCPNCGKEISDFDFITTSRIVFENAGFAYRHSETEEYYQSWPIYIASTYIEWCEIIGNIYQQHPEIIGDLITEPEKSL